MAVKIHKGDQKLLVSLGRFNFLTVIQLAALTQRSKQVIRRCMRRLSDQELVEKRERPYGTGYGRPEDIYFLSSKGRKIFKGSDSAGSQNKSEDTVMDPSCITHDLFTNWVLIHLLEIDRTIDPLSIQYVTHEVHASGSNIRHPGHIKIPTSPSNQDFIDLIPDGVFSIAHTGLRKSLLFFIEVDMGTESMASSKNRSNVIRQKIINYQTLFRTARYKQYEKLFNARFNGFRLLFITNSKSRLEALNCVVRETPPSDFVWLTNQSKMFAEGLSAKIWNRGGRNEKPAQSILGSSLACRTTVKNKIR